MVIRIVYLFSPLIDNQTLNLEAINIKEISKQCFTNRIMIKNQEQHQEIPIGKFRLQSSIYKVRKQDENNTRYRR